MKFFEGTIFHARTRPKPHRFKYKSFFIEVDPAEVPIKKGLYSVSSENYLHGKSGNLLELVKDFLAEHHLPADFSHVRLQTYPRLLGYVFNPVSFWYFFNEKNQVHRILCEVNNTFGERHFYWIEDSESLFSKKEFCAEKKFHVSPFFAVDGTYHFSFQENPRKVTINYFDQKDQLLLNSYVQGVETPLEPGTLTRLFFRYGWITALVTLRIHFQAIFLFFKKAQFHRKPETPLQKITFLKSRPAKD